MEMTGEQTIAAPRQTVWAALNDPEVLRQCIPGCQEIDKTDDTTFEAKVKAKVGPVNSTFSGTVELSDLNPPESYTISGKGSGGAAGFAKGSARVSLEDQGDQTILRYTVDAQVGGKLAQVGNRLVKSTADKYAKQFFETFNEIVSSAEAAPGRAGEAEPAQGAPADADTGVSPGESPEGPTASATDRSAAAETGDRQAGHRAAPEAGAREREQPAAGGTQHPAPAEHRSGLRPGIWIIGILIVAIVILVLATL